MLSHYYSQENLSHLLNQDNTLCVINFNGDCQPAPQLGLIQSGLALLETQASYEVWQVNQTVTRGQDGQCFWNKTDDIICSAIYIDNLSDIETATQQAYSELLAHLQRMGYPHPFRFWNYLPCINEGEGDKENYRKFCTGRLQAFQDYALDNSDFPAASALGTQAQQAVIYVFATKHIGQHFRNDKQVNAFAYPRQYGPSSPSFSRATLINFDESSLYLISGTASITGHETIAVGDLLGQLKVTLENLNHLLEKPLNNGQALTPTASKVYLRHATDLPTVQTFLENHMPNHHYLYIHADVCRDDLLVEIECHCEQ